MDTIRSRERASLRSAHRAAVTNTNPAAPVGSISATTRFTGNGVVKMWSRSRTQLRDKRGPGAVTWGFAVSPGPIPNQRYRLEELVGKMAALRVERLDLVPRREIIAESVPLLPRVRTWQHQVTPVARCRHPELCLCSPDGIRTRATALREDRATCRTQRAP